MWNELGLWKSVFELKSVAELWYAHVLGIRV